MKKVAREELLDLKAYDQQRDVIRPAVLEKKQARRVHAGGVLTFLFENADTVRYQVQEEIRVELETYNDILGGRGELGCTLLIEIEDPVERDRKLRAWMGLADHLYV